MLTARDLMTSSPPCVASNVSVREAVEALDALTVRHLPVVDADGALVGLLGDRELQALSMQFVGRTEPTLAFAEALAGTIEPFLDANVPCVDLDADVAEVIDLMLDHGVGVTPVVGRGRKLVGVITYPDLLARVPPEGLLLEHRAPASAPRDARRSRVVARRRSPRAGRPA